VAAGAAGCAGACPAGACARATLPANAIDIDGTLVLTGGAGIRAMNRACEELVGHGQALANIPVAGRTDRIILTDVVQQTGHTAEDGLLDRLRDRYIEHLSEEIERPGGQQSFESPGARGGFKGVMPGIRELLDTLERRRDVFVGLLTGNFQAGARIKLEHFGLWRYFRCGAFGDDSADRNDLVPFAVQRARECGVPELGSEHILVIGDTPHDIACARAVGAVPVAVATGGFTADQLRDHGADVVFKDFSEPRDFLKLLER
jgi:phosphoglycolate phosphatase-like HAD superfamily hydrolase